jgi:hypothetical protein
MLFSSFLWIPYAVVNPRFYITEGSSFCLTQIGLPDGGFGKHHGVNDEGKAVPNQGDLRPVLGRGQKEKTKILDGFAQTTAIGR